MIRAIFVDYTDTIEPLSLERLGILTGADLRDYGLDVLTREFGSSAAYFHGAALGTTTGRCG